MPAGLFGKLPSKRDFVAVNAPRAFLEVWEAWLQAGVATSRQLLGSNFLAVYNRAPIWRFWLGADFCGEATLGAFMSSVDGVGRSFPLTIFFNEGSQSLLPPELDANDGWCEAVEAVLLQALDPEADFDSVLRATSALAAPSLQPRTTELPGLEELSEGAVLVRDIDRQLGLAFRAARRFGQRRAFASQSFWWTIGGDGFAPLALSLVGLPQPTRFADMLTGAFDPPRTELEHGG